MKTARNTLNSPPDLSSPEARKRLAKMVMALFDQWQLTLHDQARLLGLASDARMTLFRYRTGSPLDTSRDLFGRVGHLLSIHKSLRILFPHDRDLVYRWVKTPNNRFGGKKPLDVMASGYEGLLTVRRYLDDERVR